MTDDIKAGSNVSELVDYGEDVINVNKTEIELKLSKIKNLMNSIDDRIKTHERKLVKLYQIDEREETKNKIAKMTQKILSNL